MDMIFKKDLLQMSINLIKAKIYLCYWTLASSHTKNYLAKNGELFVHHGSKFS